MADQQLATYIHYGTDAERLAFTPDPPVGFQPVYIWYATDSGITWVYDSSWHSIAGAGGGLPASVQGDLFYATGVNTVAALAKNASATRYLSNTGGSNNPAWAQVALATGVSGTLPVANGGTGVAAGFSPMLVASVALTNAQILALPTTPVEVVAAPGAGFRVKIIAPVSLISNFAAGAYTNVNATFADIHLQAASGKYVTSYILNDGGQTTPVTNATAFFGANTYVIDLPTPVLSGWNTDVTDTGGFVYVGPLDVPQWPANSDVNNDAIQVAIENNGSGNLTGGNAANSLIVRVYYVIEAVA